MYLNSTLRFGALLAGGLLAVAVMAEDTRLSSLDDRPSQLTFQLDNDLFSGSDRDYTNGVRIALLSPVTALELNWLQNLLVQVHNSLARIGAASGLISEDGGQVHLDWGTGLTQLMFTPSDYDVLVPPEGERPFAGWLGLEWSLHVHNRDSMSSLTFVVGLTGPNSLAQSMQDFVHETITKGRTFSGWDSQVPEEYTLNLQLDRKLRLRWLETLNKEGPLELDGYAEWGASFGNFRTEAHAGILVRLGYQLPPAFVTPRVQLGTYSLPLMYEGAQPKGNWSWGVFAGARGMAVAHAITLDGPIFRDYSYSMESKPFVGEALLGIGIRYTRWQLAISKTLRTEEFEGQDRAHEYGSIMLGLQF